MKTLKPEPWMDTAACAEVDPELWFPERGSSNGVQAKKICRACPVAKRCLAYALEHQEAGIWGGTSERDRRKLRSREAA